MTRSTKEIRMPEQEPGTEQEPVKEPVKEPAQDAESADNPEVPVSEAIAREIRDALELLEYAVSIGFKTEDGLTVPLSTIETIKRTAAMTTVSGGNGPPPGQKPDVVITMREWVDFELAYHGLAALLAPVTAATLRDTEAVGHGPRWWSSSPAQAFTRTLWGITGVFAAFVVLAGWGYARYGEPLEGVVDLPNTMMQLVEQLIPFAYGGLGACIYLLRSAHVFIYERTFDVRRKPEYFSRIILGVVGGGAVVLFVAQVTADDGSVIQLSSAALGFLAGYSTDFLFNTIERVIAALLPKVGLESVRRARATPGAIDVPTGDLTLKELLDRHAEAQGPDKDLYRSLIEKLRDRM